jgi:hypothetical protein
MTGLYSPKKAKKKRLEVPKSGFKNALFLGGSKTDLAQIWPTEGAKTGYVLDL